MTLANNNEILLFDDQATSQIKYELNVTAEDTQLIKSKERVQHHGEVFTPNWMVQKMLSEPSIREKIHDLHATFLEPSAGEGAFLKEILRQKLNYVDSISDKNNWRENALWAVMSIYGIELLPDNLKIARQAMFEIITQYFQTFFRTKLSIQTDFYKSVKFVIEHNIIQGNTLTCLTEQNELIELNEWRKVGDEVKRVAFTYKSLLDDGDEQLSLFDEKDIRDTEFAVCRVTKVYKEEKNNE